MAKRRRTRRRSLLRRKRYQSTTFISHGAHWNKLIYLSNCFACRSTRGVKRKGRGGGGGGCLKEISQQQQQNRRKQQQVLLQYIICKSRFRNVFFSAHHKILAVFFFLVLFIFETVPACVGTDCEEEEACGERKVQMKMKMKKIGTTVSLRM